MSPPISILYYIILFYYIIVTSSFWVLFCERRVASMSPPIILYWYIIILYYYYIFFLGLVWREGVAFMSPPTQKVLSLLHLTSPLHAIWWLWKTYFFQNSKNKYLPKSNFNKAKFLVIYPRMMFCITLPLFHQTNLYNLKNCFVQVKNGKLYISSSLHPGPKVVELFLHAIWRLCKTYFFQNCKKYLSDLKKNCPTWKVKKLKAFHVLIFSPNSKSSRMEELPFWRISKTFFLIIAKVFVTIPNYICPIKKR